MGSTVGHQIMPSDWTEREKLRNKGQFWTPSWVAEAMVAYAPTNAKLVFDPATGRGVFLKALLKLNRPHVSFYGTDIDANVLADDIYNNNRCIVEERDFLKNPPQCKFNFIVANPPYIRHHRIDISTKTFLKQRAAGIAGFNVDGRAGYHIYFLIQALDRLAQNGRLAFIMPADTCEGTFARKLWKWISDRFCIDAVITFAEAATPFPNVDTNAIIFLIRNAKPAQELFWLKVIRAHSTDLTEFIASNFKEQEYQDLEITNRDLKEAIATGLSRPAQAHNRFNFHLYDFARVMRGIATGSNEFFLLTAQQAKALRLPHDFLKRAIGRTRDVTTNTLSDGDIAALEKKSRPTYLLAINGTDNLPRAVADYLKIGESMGLPKRALIKQRRPWYKMEKREVPPLLFAYLGRRSTRFIRNEAGVLPLTGFLCVYPIHTDKAYIDNLWHALNHPHTLQNLQLVGKSYGAGAIKVEPGNLQSLPIPDHIVELFDLKRPYVTAAGQLDLLREPSQKYDASIKLKRRRRNSNNSNQ